MTKATHSLIARSSVAAMAVTDGCNRCAGACHAVKTDDDTAAIARGGPWTELVRSAKKWDF